MKAFSGSCLAVAVSACLVMGMAASAQDNQGQYYSTAQIEQFVAPVALYPDALLAQVFMASTYPGEVVEANGWARQNPGLQGDALAVALDGQNWDVSVKSLVPFPEVLNRMADNEAWTQDLGNAFLAQPNDVTLAVQSLRHRAYAAGNLRTSGQQRVVVEPQYIEVVSVSPEIIYVPAYNPMVVYGPGWGYPTYYYPAMMAPPPYYVTGNIISFGMGFAVGATLFGAFDWNQHNVYYGPNFYQYRGYQRNVENWHQQYPNMRPGGHNNWEHNPEHRGTIGYSSPVLQQKYGHGNPNGANHGAMPVAVPPAGGHNAQPVTHNPLPVAHPQQPVTHPQQPVTHNPPPVAHNPQPANHPQQPVTHNPQPANHPQQPVTHPQQPAAHNPQPVTHNPQPANHPQQPVTHPQQPAAHNPQPVTHNPQPVNHPQQPVTHPQQPASHPQQPTAHNPQPAAHNPQPAAHNPQPAAHNQQPAQPHESPQGGEKKNEDKK